jgi:hypothetical protein
MIVETSWKRSRPYFDAVFPFSTVGSLSYEIAAQPNRPPARARGGKQNK